ncbi:peptidylprolyl isomerase [Corynebacterium felinum]|uniref:Peptidyl-prolyl cis-trans isomerase B (Cyclophilin B) n=1 Tax=Corynebacterium felinum TaxID=131318 RepID=A0ABU2BB02_9CORY|nr:peptidylprolyl isomerase [Corynebacterium felinum]MDF5821915.1 peptidylprolyl isomerase [Corynebacterium felinum]MDR7355795.1 peptidyl-prolyl cis-trans isomerase B (cyclophilin B) [Corynebacterium felinum]WJY95141.1 Putative bifunctional phosphatase/peptidyl-prolyl cis-trans isomerase [Corynebacterium felinum]
MSDNSKRRAEAMRSLESAIASRDRSEKLKPLGLILMAAAAIAIIVGGIVWATLYTGGSKEETVASETQAAPVTTEEMTTPTLPPTEPLALARAQALPETVTCEYKDSGEAAKEISKPATKDVPATGTVNVVLNTNQGEVPLELDRSVSPCTVNAIEHFAKEGYYDNTVCHRLTTSEGLKVLQCGDPSGTGAGGPGFNFKNEYPTDEFEGQDALNPVKYPRGTIAMANAGADTNGSQFFLNYGDSLLPPAYTYFGKISDSGLKVLDAIAAEGVAEGGADGAPAKEVKITKAEVK